MAISLLRPFRRPQWLLPERERRLARHRKLVQGHPPVSCDTPELQALRRAWETRMASWDDAQWQAHAAPWAELLGEWLSDPVLDAEGLHDFRLHHEQAWWNARAARPAQLTTAISTLVWGRLIHEPVSSDLLSIASLSSRGFFSEVVAWAMRHPRPDLIDSLADTYTLGHQAEVLLQALPQAAPGQWDRVWQRLHWGTENATLLQGIMRSQQPHADTVLAELSQKGRQALAHDWERKPHVHDMWHKGFLSTLHAVMNGEAPERLTPWTRHFTWADPTKLHYGLHQMWQEACSEGREPQFARQLDGLTHRLTPVISHAAWLDPEFWPSEALNWMPDTNHFHLTAQRQARLAQRPATSTLRPRRRS